MCTAVSDGNLFGRTLDFERDFGESVLIIPRNFKLSFLYEKAKKTHLAMLGIGVMHGGVPLYFDAVNEEGLSAAALNFPRSAVYRASDAAKRNFASFEIITAVLSQCKDAASASVFLGNLNITKDSVASAMPSSPLHFIISDKKRSITLESTRDGVKVYENAFGVLTNEPTFPYHVTHAAEYMQASPFMPSNELAPKAGLEAFSIGMGSSALPGGNSSTARFIRAIYAKNHTQTEADEKRRISRFFSILGFVAQPFGTARTKSGAPFGTLYTSCYDREDNSLYFKTKNNNRIRCVRLSDFDTLGHSATTLPMTDEEDILYIRKV